LRCEYCDHSPTNPNQALTKTVYGQGDVNYYNDIDRWLCFECAEISFELVFKEQETEEEAVPVILYYGDVDW